MPRPKAPPRVNGPYFHAGRNRWRIRIFDGAGREDIWFASEEEARCAMLTAGDKLQTGVRTLGEALVEYLSEKERQGKAKPETCAAQMTCLRRLFADHLDEDPAKITPRRAAEIYSALVEKPCEKTGKPPEAATHRLYRALAHGFYLWAVRKGYVTQSPFRDVQPVGRPSAGKPQLTLDEAKRYRDAGLRSYDQHRDVLALAAVVPLYLGLRVSEVLSRRVRDLDCNGTMLRIPRGKTKNARRYLAIKAPALRSRLAELANGKTPDDLLFGADAKGKQRSRQTLHAAVKRVCIAAGVPVVCPHSLRGLWATLGVESGAAESAVATALGHGSFEMTARHYAQPEALSDARSDRVAGFLDGKSDDRSDDKRDDANLLNLSAEGLLAQLPESTVEKLALILSGRPRRPITA